MSALLINEPPLQVLPSLANIIGLNEAIVLQQLHYLLAFANTEHDGKKWVYNSIENWQKEHFPFWGEKTIRRALDRLVELGLIVCEKLQERTRNQTKFYTIDYEKLDEIQTKPICQNGQMEQVKMTNSIWSKRPTPSGQNDQMSVGQNDQMLQENTNRIQTREYIQESESARTHAKPPDKKFNPLTYPIGEYIDPDTWADFVEMRHSIKKPLTQGACKRFADTFAKWHAQGLNPNLAIDESIKNSWQDVYIERTQPKPFNQGANYANLQSNHQPNAPHPNSTEAYAYRLQAETEQLKRDLQIERERRAASNAGQHV